jgi:hypothetical protein
VAAALALGMAGGHDAQVALLEATRAPDSDLARLSWIGLALQRQTALAPRFAELVFAPDPRLRAIGGHALGVLGEQATTAHDPIRVALPAPLERAGTEQLEAAGLAVLGQHLQPSAAARFVAELQAAARAGLHAPRAYVQSTLTVLEAALIDGPSEPSVLDAATAQSILDGNAGDVIALAAQTDPDLRLRLLPVLGRVRSEAAATALAGLVADPHAQVRDAALDGLATATLPANGSQLEAPLAALALGDPAFGTRRRAVVVLGRLGGDGSARTLARVLSRDGYALVREAAATALAAVPASLAAPALLEALRSDDESRVRAAAARALGRLGGEPLRAARALPNLTPELRTILSAN